MVAPLLWLVSEAANGISGRRLTATVLDNGGSRMSAFTRSAGALLLCVGLCSHAEGGITRVEWGTTAKTPLAPAPARRPYAEVLEALNKRRASLRRYDPAGLTFAELSQLLRLCYGITSFEVPPGQPPARNIACRRLT